MKLNAEELVVTSFATSDGPQAAEKENSSPLCPTPATICFICPVSAYTECDRCGPTPMTICFICPPLTHDCAVE